MKILTNKQIKEIDINTSRIIDFIHELPNDSIKKPVEKIHHISLLNNIRSCCGLFQIILPVKPRFLTEIKPTKEERHEHDYFILHTSPTNATICCRSCGEVKHIETNVPMKKASPKQYINISIDEFCDYCDAAASFKELKELLFERPAMQEGES